jgi:hypothetical protein
MARRLNLALKSLPATHMRVLLSKNPPPMSGGGEGGLSPATQEAMYVEQLMGAMLSRLDEAVGWFRVSLEARAFTAAVRTLWNEVGGMMCPFLGGIEEGSRAIIGAVGGVGWGDSVKCLYSK